MSDAREWLAEVQDQNSGDDSTCGALLRAETAALLAVLDECDRIMDGIDTPYQRSEITAYMHSGVAVTVNRMRAAINAVLGVDDE